MEELLTFKPALYLSFKTNFKILTSKIFIILGLN